MEFASSPVEHPATQIRMAPPSGLRFTISGSALWRSLSKTSASRKNEVTLTSMSSQRDSASERSSWRRAVYSRTVVC